ncbi:hypothetical protein WJX72_008070 [[Myrmecia] bisecta]|uniref:Uncharacterized protein n=1 Tax=[Myrmecia] bisecta TaxID=41462 RepID=A0AAW1R8F9_9CHLO
MACATAGRLSQRLWQCRPAFSATLTRCLASEAGIKPPVPPFTQETAKQKTQLAEDAWNSRDPNRVSLAYSEDSQWRNRSEFFTGRAAIRDFLTRKWQKELDYRLMKELWCYQGNRISVRFEYEYHDKTGQWWRAHGNEHWEYNEQGLMTRRDMSANDYRIEKEDRRYTWPREATP